MTYRNFIFNNLTVCPTWLPPYLGQIFGEGTKEGPSSPPDLKLMRSSYHTNPVLGSPTKALEHLFISTTQLILSHPFWWLKWCIHLEHHIFINTLLRSLLNLNLKIIFIINQQITLFLFIGNTEKISAYKKYKINYLIS